MDIDTDMDFFFLTKLAFIRLFLDLAPTVTAKTQHQYKHFWEPQLALLTLKLQKSTVMLKRLCNHSLSHTTYTQIHSSELNLLMETQFYCLNIGAQCSLILFFITLDFFFGFRMSRFLKIFQTFLEVLQFRFFSLDFFYFKLNSQSKVELYLYLPPGNP